MEILRTITDDDFGLGTPEPQEYELREAARAIVFDTDNKVALLHASNKYFHKLPGGGIEEGEDRVAALERECIEEIGCKIRNIRELGTVEEFRKRHNLHQFSYCYIADLDGEKGEPQLEADEIADGFRTVWLTIDEAIQTLANEEGVEDYQGKFIQQRDLLLLKEAKKLL